MCELTKNSPSKKHCLQSSQDVPGIQFWMAALQCHTEKTKNIWIYLGSDKSNSFSLLSKIFLRFLLSLSLPAQWGPSHTWFLSITEVSSSSRSLKVLHKIDSKHNNTMHICYTQEPEDNVTSRLRDLTFSGRWYPRRNTECLHRVTRLEQTFFCSAIMIWSKNSRVP